MHKLTIIVPVYNEAEGIIPFLDSLRESVKTKFELMLCYDHDDDTTLKVIDNYQTSFKIHKVKNIGVGPHQAVLTGFEKATTSAVLVMTADDDYNAPIIDKMFYHFEQGADIVCPSRFTSGGFMEGCPLIKAILVRTASFSLYHFARFPIHDATNGFRLFSKDLINIIDIESTQGFTYSIELTAKAHRLGRKIVEVPAKWIERKTGSSRFRVFKWLLPYLRWYFYIFATNYLFRGKNTVKIKKDKSIPKNND